MIYRNIVNKRLFLAILNKVQLKLFCYNKISWFLNFFAISALYNWDNNKINIKISFLYD